jgi:DOPA 4,5-dioxygenase
VSGSSAPLDAARITQYHAHIYYDPLRTREEAALLREQLAQICPDARLGRWHDELVGPHPQAMYQVAFAPQHLATILPWLMLNRRGLTILVHPETGNAYADHSRHALWLGAVLALRLDVLKGSRAT